MPKLLTPMASNPKTRKGLEAHGVEGALLHLLSHTQASVALGHERPVNLCPFAEVNGCASACLVNQGRGRMSTVFAGRLRRTRKYLEDRDAFIAELRGEIAALERRARRKGLRPVVRLDGTSDIGLAENLAPLHPGVTFYDYTKVKARVDRVARAHSRGELLNYHVTFSRGGGNESDAIDVLRAGGNVTVVFRTPSRRKGPLPATWHGFRVVDGDEHDLRFLDPAGVVVGLRAKGSAIDDRTGFVAELEG